MAFRIFCHGCTTPYRSESNPARYRQKIIVLTTRRIDNNKDYIPSKKTASYNFLYEVTGTKYKSTNEGIRQWPPYVLNHSTKEQVFKKKYDINNTAEKEVFKYREQMKIHMAKILEEVKEGEENISGKERENITDAILFIHGFNVSSNDARKTAEEIRKASGKHVIVYDWASNHAGNRFFSNPIRPASMYADDYEIADYSADVLGWILVVLLFEIENLHIIAHSMGSKIAISSISKICHDYRMNEREFKLSGLDKGETESKFKSSNNLHEHGFVHILHEQMIKRIRSVVFVQPDVDIISMSKFIRRDIDGTVKFANGNTELNRLVRIYGHRHDNALRISQFVHSGIPRTGQVDSKFLSDIITSAEDEIGHHKYNVNWTKNLFFGDKGVMQDASIFCSNTWGCDMARLDNNILLNTINSVPWFLRISLCSNKNHSYFENPRFQESLRKFYKGENPTDQ